MQISRVNSLSNVKTSETASMRAHYVVRMQAQHHVRICSVFTCDGTLAECGLLTWAASLLCVQQYY